MKKASFLKGLNSFFITCLFICFLFSHSFSMSHDDYDKDGACDNTRHHATPILINDPNHPQLHNLYDPNDVDWVMFHAYRNREYKVSVRKSGTWHCSLKAHLYDPNGTPVSDRILYFFEDPNDQDLNNVYLCPNNICEGFLPQAGFYFLKFERKSSHMGNMGKMYRTADSEIPTDANIPEYDYEIIEISDGYPGTTTILGYVLNESDLGLGGAQIIVDDDDTDPPYLTTTSFATGVYYLFDLQVGSDPVYQIYAKMPGYSDSSKISISLEENALYKLNIYLSSNPSDPNSGSVPSSGDGPWPEIVPPSYADRAKYYVSTFYTGGINFFSSPCQLSQCDCNCVIRQGYDFVAKYYDPDYDPDQYYDSNYDPIQFFMEFQRHDSNGQWQTCYLDTNLSMSILGEPFNLDPHEGYLVYINIRDPNKDIKKLPFIFKCAQDPNEDGFNLTPGTNLTGFFQPPSGYDSYFFLEDPNQKNVVAFSHYVPRRGSFYTNYRFFGRPCGYPCLIIEDKGYILSVKEGGSP